MGKIYLSSSIKSLITERANGKCEYCLVDSKFSFFPFHIEHIISLKHQGQTIESNLAFSCPLCNLNKGTDLGTFLDNQTELIRFYNPRIDAWNDHFELIDSGEIFPKTKIGAATIKTLQFNAVDSIIERKILIRYKLIKT